MPRSLEPLNAAVTVGAPATLRWTAGDGDSIEVSLTSCDAQNTRSTSVFCKVSDTGSFTIPANITSKLVAGGKGTLYVTRSRSLGKWAWTPNPTSLTSAKTIPAGCAGIPSVNRVG